MGANSHSESDADSPDTDARIYAKSSATNRLNDTAEMVAAALVADATDYHGQTSVGEIRSMLRNTTRMIIARARQNSELTGKLWAAIDVTKGFPFTGDVEDHEDDILGHRDGNEYYQWAVLKIVGMDVPLVLDAIPRERGQSKDEIVEKLLEHTIDRVG
jgi:hypothetical protein